MTERTRRPEPLLDAPPPETDEELRPLQLTEVAAFDLEDFFGGASLDGDVYLDTASGEVVWLPVVVPLSSCWAGRL